MSHAMRAVVVTPDAPAKLALGEVQAPVAERAEALVRVTAFSLNRGEVNFAQGKDAGARIGWDIAGVVEAAAADGSGPEQGARVAGFVAAQTGWAEQVAVPARYLAEIPQGVSDEDAAALPVAALTALFGLERGGSLLAQRVLVTGANGGVGLFACQLAKLMGAHVVAQVRSGRHTDTVKSAGAAEVVVDAEGAEVAASGPYHLIFDGIGGPILSHAAKTMRAGAGAIVYGVTAKPTAELSLGPLLGSGDARVEGFNLYHEATRRAPVEGLQRLMTLVAEGRLSTFIQRRGDWSEVGAAAKGLLDRAYYGKAVLTVS